MVASVIGGAAYYLIDRQMVTDLVGGAEYSEDQLNEGDVADLYTLTLPEAK
ncbi:hypothetical protein [Pseudomonas sp.]|uniref:hypothetical protein n=1 Tax=Pseudomonas sp. TaxID=306 RepID=UPI00326456EB